MASLRLIPYELPCEIRYSQKAQLARGGLWASVLNLDAHVMHNKNIVIKM